MSNCVGYLQETLSDPAALAATVNVAYDKIQSCIPADSYDCIAFRGISGAVVAPVVAVRLRKGLVPVRKGEEAHSYIPVELGNDAYRRYIIVDDFIESGETMKAIIKACDGHDMKCVGIVTYRGYSRNDRRPCHPRYDEHEGAYWEKRGPETRNIFWYDYYRSYPVYPCRI